MKTIKYYKKSLTDGKPMYFGWNKFCGRNISEAISWARSSVLQYVVIDGVRLENSREISDFYHNKATA